MTEQRTSEQLLDLLRRDLGRLGDRLDDADFAGQLYRALTTRTWRRVGEDDGAHVALSFTRAEDLVNELRGERGTEPLTLAQTGGEGEVSRAVQHELAALGWASRPLDTSRPDPAHVDSPRAEPRVHPDEQRFVRAHEQAEQERRRQAEGGARSR